MTVSWFAIMVAVPLGCAEPRVSPDEGSATQAIETFVPHQGRLLLGFKAPDVRQFTFPGLSTVRVDATGRLTSSTVSGAGFRGAKLVATGDSQTITMRIAEVIPPVSPETQWQYILQQLEGTRWVTACDTPTPLIPPDEPPESVPRAYALPGTWIPDGLYHVAGSISFACKTGVVGKCTTWGYPSGGHWPHTTKLGTPTPALGPDMLQACTRMARADYCATGMPNTLEGTPIHIDDVFTYGPPDPAFPFEAAWPGIAWTDRVGIRRPSVVCLSKLRWSTLPIGGDCPLLVPDPRETAKGKFCEDMSPVEMETRGALVYSSSTFIDTGLYTYRDPSTGRRFTTSSLVPDNFGKPPRWTITPPAGVGFPFPNQPAPSFEATIFAAALPVPIPDTNLVKLNSYRCGNDLITTTAALDSAICPQLVTEGWVYPPNTANRAQLRRWHLDGQIWTTATAPSTMLANGWLLDEVVGGVLRAAIDVNVRWSGLGGGYQYALDLETRAGEWISSCVPAGTIGGATAFAFNGLCGTRAVHHADVIAFRVTATQLNMPTVVSAPQPYDGYSSDVYLPIDGGFPTALALHWNALPDAQYAIDFSLGGIWVRCVDPKQLANETSYVHVQECYAEGTPAKLGQVRDVRVCALQNGNDVTCTQQKYTGEPSLTFAL